MELMAAMAKVSGLPNLDDLIARLPSDATLRPVDEDIGVGPVLAVDIKIFDIDFAIAPIPLNLSAVTNDTPLPMPILRGTRPITIRIPNKVLTAMKAEASKKCIGYQTHINRVLKAAVAN